MTKSPLAWNTTTYSVRTVWNLPSRTQIITTAQLAKHRPLFSRRMATIEKNDHLILMFGWYLGASLSIIPSCCSFLSWSCDVVFFFCPPDLIHCTNELNVSIPHLADTLLERTTSNSWIVVFKALITTHHLMMYGNEVSSMHRRMGARRGQKNDESPQKG